MSFLLTLNTFQFLSHCYSFMLKRYRHEHVLSSEKKKKTCYNQDSGSSLNYDANLTTAITWGSNFVIHNLFTCNVNSPI